MGIIQHHLGEDEDYPNGGNTYLVARRRREGNGKKRKEELTKMQICSSIDACCVGWR